LKRVQHIDGARELDRVHGAKRISIVIFNDFKHTLRLAVIGDRAPVLPARSD
jgi:hypothetical protein